MFGYKKSLTPWSQNNIQSNFSLGKYYLYIYGPAQILCTAHNKQRTRFFLVLQHRIGLRSTWTCRFGKLGWDIYRQTIFRKFNLKSNQKNIIRLINKSTLILSTNVQFLQIHLHQYIYFHVLFLYQRWSSYSWIFIQKSESSPTDFTQI